MQLLNATLKLKSVPTPSLSSDNRQQNSIPSHHSHHCFPFASFSKPKHGEKHPETNVFLHQYNLNEMAKYPMYTAHHILTHITHQNNHHYQDSV